MVQDRRWQVTYFSPAGRAWELSSHEWVAGLRAGGISGLVSAPTVSTFTSLGAPGQLVEAHQIPAASGSLDVFVRSDGVRSATEVWAQLRGEFRARPPLGKLVMMSPSGPATAMVRLSGPLPPPETDDAFAEVKPLKIPLSIDEGVWWLEPRQVAGARVVDVVNRGDVVVWPELRWQGAGGRVELPSGASVVLPSAATQWRVSLDPLRARSVVDARGVVNVELSNQLRRGLLPEGVQPDRVGRFRLPAGVTLRWCEGVLNPWR